MSAGRWGLSHFLMFSLILYEDSRACTVHPSCLSCWTSVLYPGTSHPPPPPPPPPWTLDILRLDRSGGFTLISTRCPTCGTQLSPAASSSASAPASASFPPSDSNTSLTPTSSSPSWRSELEFRSSKKNSAVKCIFGDLDLLVKFLRENSIVF